MSAAIFIRDARTRQIALSMTSSHVMPSASPVLAQVRMMNISARDATLLSRASLAIRAGN